MKISFMLILTLILATSSLCIMAGAGSVTIDIVGSKADNTKVCASGPEHIELEIVGSTTNNTEICTPTCHPHCKKSHHHEEKHECIPVHNNCDDRHLGVDAWYGTFWYKDNPSMPQWPQY